jgi:transcriptional regulator with XRE-family HTH domain
MQEALTEELLDQLLSAPKVEDYLTHAPLVDRSLGSYLERLMNDRGLTRSEVAKRASVNYNHLYDAMTRGKRIGRDRLIAIAFALGLTTRETDRLLQCGGCSALYAKDRRDAIIIFALAHGYTNAEVDVALFEFGEPTLRPDLGESSPLA